MARDEDAEEKQRKEREREERRMKHFLEQARAKKEHEQRAKADNEVRNQRYLSVSRHCEALVYEDSLIHMRHISHASLCFRVRSGQGHCRSRPRPRSRPRSQPSPPPRRPRPLVACRQFFCIGSITRRLGCDRRYHRCRSRCLCLCLCRALQPPAVRLRLHEPRGHQGAAERAARARGARRREECKEARGDRGGARARWAAVQSRRLSTGTRRL